MKQERPTRVDDGDPPEDEHTDHDDAAVEPQEWVLEDESEVDDEKSEGTAAPRDSLTPPRIERVRGVGVDVGKNMHGLVPQSVPDNA